MQTTIPIRKWLILTQNRLFKLTKIKRSQIFFGLMLFVFMLFFMLTATPNNETIHVQARIVNSKLTLPFVAATSRSNELFWQLDQVRRYDTLGKLFARMGVHDDAARKFLMLNPDAEPINTQLMPGHTMAAKTNADGKLLHLTYELQDDNVLVASLTPSGYQITTKKLILENQQVIKSATIASSLFKATDDAGIPDSIALKIADIFSSVIDFNEDIRSGDKFNVLYEAFYHNGELIKTGNVLAVELLTRGKLHQAIHFSKSDAKLAYYTPEGENLRKPFLRSPLEFTRVSSSFSRGRMHPILNQIRAHKGVDFAAAHGTRIKATGDGVIQFKGRKGGYGKAIIIKHNRKISTVYGHLSRFAPKVKIGAKIKRGDVIGYVGKTGLATGPHLHYEFLLNGIHRNPMTVELPSGKPIDPTHKQAFNMQAKAMFTKIRTLNRKLVATSKCLHCL